MIIRKSETHCNRPTWWLSQDGVDVAMVQRDLDGTWYVRHQVHGTFELAAFRKWAAKEWSTVDGMQRCVDEVLWEAERESFPVPPPPVTVEVNAIHWLSLRGHLPEGVEPGPGLRPRRAPESWTLVEELLQFLEDQDISPVRTSTIGGGVYEGAFFRKDWLLIAAWLRERGVSVPASYTHWEKR